MEIFCTYGSKIEEEGIEIRILYFCYPFSYHIHVH